MRYEIRFGDDSVGRAVKDGEVVDLEYLVTSGPDGNQVGTFSFIGKIEDSTGKVYPTASVNIVTKQKSQQGDTAETVESIKYNAPRYYSAQYRAVTARDYEAIIESIYPRTESVSVVGGEELNAPQFGKVQISIKPKNGTYVSDFDKLQIKN